MKNYQKESLPVTKITVSDQSLVSKRQFLKVMDSVVVIHNDQKSFTSVSCSLTGEDSFMAFLSVEKVVEAKRKVSVLKPEIHVCRTDFIDEVDDYTDLMKYVVLHEKVEAWNMVGRRMFSDNEKEDIQYEDLAHHNALIAEFMAANKDGNGIRYLKLMKNSANKFKDKNFANYFIRENILASKKAVEIIESRKLR
jgi:hypothetical protein